MKLQVSVCSCELTRIDFREAKVVDLIILKDIDKLIDIAELKYVVATEIDFAPLSSPDVSDMRLFYNDEELNESHIIGDKIINEEDSLILVVNADVCYEKRKLMKLSKSLEEVFIEIRSIYEANKVLKGEIDAIKDVNELQYFAKFGVDGETLVPSFSITENAQVTHANEIIERYQCNEAMTELAGGAGLGTPTALIEITDFFNDKISYKSFSTYQDLTQLNETMFPVTQKFFNLFEPENKKILRILLEFLENYLIINRHMKALRRKFNHHQSRLDRLQKYAYQIKSILEHLMDEGVLFDQHAYKFYRSSIVDSTIKNVLISYLPDDVQSIKPTIIYHSTSDGKVEKTYFDKCNGQGRYVLIFKSTQGYIFGGYTNHGFNGGDRWVTDNQAFLFSLHNPHGKYFKFAIGQNNQHAMYHHSSKGPIFGGGNDLNAANFSTNITFPNLGHTYVNTSGCGSNAFTGSNSCQVDVIEAWKF